MLKHLLVGLVVSLGTTACPCEEDRCDSYTTSVADPAITQGIAGFGAAPSDVCDFGCCACEPRDFPIDLYFAGAEAPADDAAARAIFAEADDHISLSTGANGYEQALDAGFWLACSQDIGSDCILLDIDVDTVTSVHIVSSNDLPGFRVYAADGNALEPRVYEDVVFDP